MRFLNSASNVLHEIGQKVKHLPQVVGTIKGLYDVGKTIYTAGKAIAPIARALII
jgi:hypothetical protein